MFEGYFIVALAFACLGVLSLIVWLGDFWMRSGHSSGGRPLIYALPIAAYIGSILIVVLGWPLLRRVVQPRRVSFPAAR